MSNFKSKIILCCITPTVLKEEIDENSLHNIFKIFGTVEKILIFEKNVLVKAFIEMEKFSDIPKILEELDDAQYNIGKINAYLSKKSFLKAVPFVKKNEKNGSSGFKQFDQQKFGNHYHGENFRSFEGNHFESFEGNNFRSFQGNNFEGFEGTYGNEFDKQNYDNNFEKKKFLNDYENTKNVNKNENHSKTDSFGKEEQDKVNFNENFKNNLNLNRNFSNFQKSYNSFGNINLDQRYFYHNNPQFNTFQNFGRNNNFRKINSLSSFDNFSKFEKNKKEKGKVLIINRINIEKLNCKMMMNLFGCFGNVKKIILNKKNSYCLVEMENNHQANLCLKSLKKLKFFENDIRIKISNYPFLNLKSLEKDQPPNVEFFYGHKRFFRYKNNLHIKVNPPSNQLHITSISKEINCFFLYELISQINEPEKIIRLKKKGSTNSPMFLVFFGSVGESMEVLSVIHNENLNGKILKVSFSHTKL